MVMACISRASKVLRFSTGKPVSDSDHMRDMGLKEKQKVMMVGSLEETISKAMELPDEIPEVRRGLAYLTASGRPIRRPLNIESQIHIRI